MSATRSTNLQPQQRLDLPSIKLIESSSNYDLDLLAGVSLAGKYPVVFKGLVLNATNVIGTKPEFLTLSVANSVIWHYLASESGTIFQINSTEPDQVLSSSNPNVSGTFTGGMNYVGIDLYKTPDSSTSDTAAFLDADTEEEFNQVIPLARTIKYKIIITSQPFSVASNVLPIAKVLVTSGTITSITDARNMMFRLGSGGDNPNSDNVFGWGSRTENPITVTSNTSPSPFSGEDKNIGSLKDWMNSVMSSIWEIRGGTKWYSQQNRDNVKLAYGQPVLSNGDNLWFLNGVAVTSALSRAGSTVTVTLNNHPFTVGAKFELNSTDTVNFPSGVKTVTNVTGVNTVEYAEAGPASTSGAGSTIVNTVAWTGLNLLFENSNNPSIYSNIINSSSLVVPDSHAIYVDLDRGSNAAITPAVKPMYLLGGSAIPGRRIILAWRNGAYVYTKDRPYEAGRTFLAATTTALGLVKINQTAGTPAAPVVVVLDGNGAIAVTATVGNTSAAVFTGIGSGAGVRGIGGTGDGNGVEGVGTNEGAGVLGQGGAVDGTGVKGVGGGAGAGVEGTGGAGGGVGVAGVGTGGQPGVSGTSSTGVGVDGLSSGATPAVNGTNFGSGPGVNGQGGSTGPGVKGTGGASGGNGADFTGGNNAGANGGAGVRGVGGTGASNGGAGVVGVGGGTNGNGVSGAAASSTSYGLVSVIGDVGAPTTNNFKYTSTNTGSIWIPATDFLAESGGYSNYGTTVALFGSVYLPVWHLTSAGSMSLWANIKTPKGSTVTSIETLVYNSTGSTSTAYTISCSLIEASSLSPITLTPSVLIPSTALSIPTGAQFVSTSVTPVVRKTGKPTAGNSDFIMFNWNGNSTNIHLAGIRVTFNYTSVDFPV